MDPLTHIAVSLAASRAGLNRTTRLATPMLIVAGLAPSLDWLTGFAGKGASLIGYRTYTHSVVGAAAIATITALCFMFMGRKHPTEPLRFSRALALCFVGATLHVLLDLMNSYGVKLFWPLSNRWYALDSLPNIDLWMLLALLAGILLPMLFRLVTEEIGAKQKSQTGASGAVMALVLVLLYIGGRIILHSRAIELLNSRLYQGATPVAVGAFPDSSSPFHWRGVVVTEPSLFRVDVPVVFGTFDPFAAKLFYKPESSAALDAARATQTAQLFLSFARYPRAIVEKTDTGFHVEITDMRFETGAFPQQSAAALIDLNQNGQVLHEGISPPVFWLR